MLEGKDIIDFSITSWYDKFKHILLETILVILPTEVQKVLMSLQSEAVELITENPPDQFDDETRNAIDRFRNEVNNALNTLNKNAWIKNNWHAPTDAKMFSLNQLLKVSNIEDCLQYLVMSCRLMNDFQAKGVPYCLAFRPWLNIHPAAEFRCIVVNKTLRGISPRDWPVYYPHFEAEAMNIIKLTKEFFDVNIKAQFPREDYTFDIFWPSTTEGIVLLDFGPLNGKADLYAFTIQEILRLKKKGSSEELAPIFRYLNSDIGIMRRKVAALKINSVINSQV